MEGAYKIIVILLVLAVVAMGAWFLKNMFAGENGPSEYSMVALSTGEVYFGRLSWFPNPTLREVWILQRSGDQTGVVPFTRAFWGPVDKLSLNKKNIVSWTRLKKSSELVNAFHHPELLEGSGAPAPAANTPSQ
jgi:hypothetical protein